MRKTWVAGALATITLVGTGATTAIAHEHHHAQVKTLHFVDTQIRSASTRLTFTASGVDKHNGKVIGFSALSGVFNPKTQLSRVDVGLALNGGILELAFDPSGNTPRLHGHIVSGTRAFRHARGTVNALQTSNTRTVVTIRYTVSDND
jgi:hypothetical protein